MWSLYCPSEAENHHHNSDTLYRFFHAPVFKYHSFFHKAASQPYSGIKERYFISQLDPVLLLTAFVFMSTLQPLLQYCMRAKQESFSLQRDHVSWAGSIELIAAMISPHGHCSGTAIKQPIHVCGCHGVEKKPRSSSLTPPVSSTLLLLSMI